MMFDFEICNERLLVRNPKLCPKYYNQWFCLQQLMNKLWIWDKILYFGIVWSWMSRWTKRTERSDRPSGWFCAENCPRRATPSNEPPSSSTTVPPPQRLRTTEFPAWRARRCWSSVDSASGRPRFWRWSCCKRGRRGKVGFWIFQDFKCIFLLKKILHWF